MAKALDVNDTTAPNQKRPPQQPDNKPIPEKVEGKAFQVNENSVEDGEPGRAPTPPRPESDDKLQHHKVDGKAFQVNKDSVKN